MDSQAHDQAHSQAHSDGYTGPVRLMVEGRELEARVTLRGYFEPLDGRYHWYGRLAADEQLTELVGTNRASAVLTTPHGSASGQLSDPDTWGRLRISGLSTPPFPIARSLRDVEPAEPAEV
jgi:hypothetical protein